MCVLGGDILNCNIDIRLLVNSAGKSTFIPNNIDLYILISLTDPPIFLRILILSFLHLVTASLATLAISEQKAVILELNAVAAIGINSPSSTLSLVLLRYSKHNSLAILNPLVILLGCTSLCLKNIISLTIAHNNKTTLVVPSPQLTSCESLTEDIIL
ncbi:hypothetical protein HERIO_2160 [Hepatospora eriocheir]|uniref:Uncharacterized protein n=1 Tax=Hepatospora eriocheir TaxID=1081669 RepID=A0A1X0Q7W5_9MICR|nr:hypothetical protein HERIO_2160 [Hepatospora eriocheir]